MQVVIHAGAAFTDEGQVLSSLSANKQALADCRAAILGPRGGRQFVKVLSDALAQDLSDAETVYQTEDRHEISTTFGSLVENNIIYNVGPGWRMST